MNLDNGNSLKGDVWSFGVLLWEMFNLCTKIPYSELDEFPHVDSDNNEFQLDLESYLSNPWNRLRRPTAMEVPEPMWAYFPLLNIPIFRSLYFGVNLVKDGTWCNGAGTEIQRLVLISEKFMQRSVASMNNTDSTFHGKMQVKLIEWLKTVRYI